MFPQRDRGVDCYGCNQQKPYCREGDHLSRIVSSTGGYSSFCAQQLLAHLRSALIQHQPIPHTLDLPNWSLDQHRLVDRRATSDARFHQPDECWPQHLRATPLCQEVQDCARIPIAFDRLDSFVDFFKQCPDADKKIRFKASFSSVCGAMP